MSKATQRKRVAELKREWKMLRFGLSEMEGAEAWAESMARHEDECPAINGSPSPDTLRAAALYVDDCWAQRYDGQINYDKEMPQALAALRAALEESDR